MNVRDGTSYIDKLSTLSPAEQQVTRSGEKAVKTQQEEQGTNATSARTEAPMPPCYCALPLPPGLPHLIPHPHRQFVQPVPRRPRLQVHAVVGAPSALLYSGR
jgi:hypothetical protein